MSDDFVIPAPHFDLATPGLAGDVRVGGGTEDPMLQLAHEFEAMLILQMLRQMQQSVLSDEEGQRGFGAGPLGDTMHQEVARQMAQTGGFGLAEGLAEALARQNGVAATSAEPPGALPSHGVAPPIQFERAAPPVQLERAAPLAPASLPHLAVPMPLESSLSSDFGWRTDPINGQGRFHGGVDIRAAHGQEVPAAKAGRVVAAGTQGGYGRTVVLEHEGGVRTRYAHLSSLSVATGQTVGEVGQTGRATGPHLHFEVLQEGQRLDPQLAARRFAAALKKVEADADFPIGGPDIGPRVAVE